MKDRIVELSLRKTSILVGIGFVMMFVLAIIAKFVAFSNIIIPRKSTTTVVNIRVNMLLFSIGVVCYLFVQAFDFFVSHVFNIILKPIKKNLVSLSTSFRLAFAVIKGIRLMAPVFQYPNVYLNRISIAYVFFISNVYHIGYSILMDSFRPINMGNS